MHRFRLMHQKLSQKRFFVPLLVALLWKIQFPTKNFAFSIFDWVKPWIGLKNQLSNFAISFVYILSTLKKKSSAENVCMCVCKHNWLEKKIKNLKKIASSLWILSLEKYLTCFCTRDIFDQKCVSISSYLRAYKTSLSIFQTPSTS